MNKEEQRFGSSLSECGAKAVYRYGNIRTGRNIPALLCGRQFVPGHRRHFLQSRPVCDKCGKKSISARRRIRIPRFRCSAYPGCRIYLKITKENVKEEMSYLYPCVPGRLRLNKPIIKRNQTLPNGSGTTDGAVDASGMVNINLLTGSLLVN